MMLKLFWRLALCLCLISNLNATRLSYTINEAWKFSKGEQVGAQRAEFDDSAWEVVDIPHTWNAVDAVSEPEGYFRGEGWYRRSIYIGAEAADKQVFAFFEGANQITDLYINGKHVGQHAGGYTRFCFDLTKWIKPEAFNQFTIKVDNSDHPDIPPLSADFTFFGGVYRDVYLKFTEKVHVSLTDYASSGVYLTTPEVSNDKAVINVRTLVENAMDTAQQVRIEHTFLNSDSEKVQQHAELVKIEPGTRLENKQQGIVIENPLLWDTVNPHLYTVYTRVINAETGDVLDEVHNPLGLRWFEFDADKGLILNGKYVKLVGTNRHQCFEGLGNALRDEYHVQDVKLLKAMGGNFLRVSHYPQDPVVMEMCDRLGIVTSVEIPSINWITENQGYIDRNVEMAKEMIRQDFNRPSVLIWNYMNEIMLRSPYKKKTPEYAEYCKNMAEYGRVLEETIRAEDPDRYTMLVFHGALSAYEAAGLVELPMLVGWNLYQGWYGSNLAGFDKFLDNFHQKYPDIPMFVSEYGPGVDPRLHSFEPQRFDFTVEYGNIYHEHYLQAIMERPFVVGSNIWNLNDFHSAFRIDAVPFINSKGITTVNRELKDPYLLYTAALVDEPVVLIGSKDWKKRAGVANADGKTIQPVKIYSNGDQVEVVHNSQSLGSFEVKNYAVNVDIPFVDGSNVIEASVKSGGNLLKRGKVIRDLYRVQFDQVPFDLKDRQHPFTEINVTLGSQRYFEDRKGGVTFIPEQPYTEGSWGYIGGELNLPKTRFGKLPASEKNIFGTDQDPIFQTQRVGLEAFKLDVPDGRYGVYLYFAELDSDHQREALAYNLGQDVIQGKFEERIFNIDINGSRVLNRFDMAGQVGVERAIIKKFEINVRNGEGLTVSFDAIHGKTALNAVRVYRMY